MSHDSHLAEATQESITRALLSASSPETRRAFEQCHAALASCKSLDDVNYVRGVFQDVKIFTLFVDVHTTTARATERLSRLTRK